MSNPYAPPEDRPRDAQPPEEPAGGPPDGDAPGGGLAQSGQPQAVRPSGQPERSPEGVPYERPRGQTGHPAPHPTDLHRVAVLTRTTALLVLGSVVAGLLRFPIYLATVPLVLAAAVVGIRGLTVASRGHVRGAPRAVLGLLIAVALLGLARPALTLLTWDVESEYAACRAGAITVQAQNVCQAAYERALDERTSHFTRPTP